MNSKSEEEAKREKMFDPAQRWKAIQDFLTWSEQQLPEEKRRNRPRWKSPEYLATIDEQMRKNRKADS